MPFSDLCNSDTDLKYVANGSGLILVTEDGDVTNVGTAASTIASPPSGPHLGITNLG